MNILPLIIILLLAGAGVAIFLMLRKKDTAPSAQIVIPKDVVSLRSDAWVFSFSPNMSVHPMTGGKGFFFDFPGKDGVHYLMVPYSAANQHKLMNLTFRITATSGTPKFVSTQDGGQGTFRPMVERVGDHLTMNQEFFRFWSAPNNLVADSMVHQINWPLDWTKWTSVFGHTNQTEFDTTMKNLMGVGITFGGQSDAGHGVYVTGGTARFEVLDLTIV